MNKTSIEPIQATKMGLLPDRYIRELCETKNPMISPFVDYAQFKKEMVKNSKTGLISYGLTSYGYDVRVGSKFKVFTNSYGGAVVDPKNFDEKAFVDVSQREMVGGACIIPPNSFALASTVEKFNIPENVLAICLGKSTYARCGIIVNVTPLEPGWVGTVTIEISNTTTLPVKIYPREGIAQVLFYATAFCERTYAHKKGKYQNQKDITLAKPNTH